jgi:hypothetical protein
MNSWANWDEPMFYSGTMSDPLAPTLISDFSDTISIISNMPLVSQAKIIQVCDGIKELLLKKNRKYGDSALNPVRIFSKADSAEAIRVRIDDKLSRIQSGQCDEDEDVIDDLIGYLVLYKIALSNQS